MEKDPSFHFENIAQAIAFVCQKGVDNKTAELCENTYFMFCAHQGAPLHDTVGILATRESFQFKETLNAPN